MNELLLKKLVEEGNSIRAISQETGKSYGSIRHWLKKYKIKTLFVTQPRKKKFSKEDLIPIVARCKNYSEVTRELGYKVCGGRVNWVKNHIHQYGISIEHFESTQERMTRIGNMANSQSKEDIYNVDALSSEWGRINAQKLRNYLLFNGIEEKCKCCNNSEWLGKPLRLDIDHVNDDPHDNRLINLQFLCPNCHRQKTIPI